MVEMLLAANVMMDQATLQVPPTRSGEPPVDGILHSVHDGDTLVSIAARYGVTVEVSTGYQPNGDRQSTDLLPYKQILVSGVSCPERDAVVPYLVREGDFLAGFVQHFRLQPEAIAWANDLPASYQIVPGPTLAILSVDGFIVPLEQGDTVESLAVTYEVEPSVIRDSPPNELGALGALVARL